MTSLRMAPRVAFVTALGAAALLLSSGSVARAQDPTRQPRRPSPTAQTPRRQETIEIRGQVPTPQVVTVRPREMPAYSRRALVPMFFDHDFWPSILPPLEIVSPSGAGSAVADSTARTPADSTARARPLSPRPPLGTPRAPRTR